MADQSVAHASNVSQSLVKVSTDEDLIDQEESRLQERLELEIEAHVSKSRVLELLHEKSASEEAISEVLNLIHSIESCLQRIGSCAYGNGLEKKEKAEGYLGDLVLKTKCVCEIAMVVESKIQECEKKRRKEMKELEDSIVSLTEENRDVHSLLRVALMEKAAVERSLNKLRGRGEQNRVAVLQIAERGLQKFGLGFMMGAIAGESQFGGSNGSDANANADENRSEEEVVSVISIVEKMMKNLRLEITNLKRSLEDSRLDNTHLQSLVDEQAQKLTDSMIYIKDLEERENMLMHNVAELMMEVKEAEEEVARWREACELEVEAGKASIEERERQVTMLTEELEMIKASLEASNKKLKLKEKLAATAMSAQEAAEVSLRLADSRTASLRERIEELTKQLEEEANRTRRESKYIHRRVRHVCWPWQILRFTNTTATPQTINRSTRTMTPEREALLHISI